MRSAIEILQPVGRALMLPIAVLPIAGLLLRFGQPDLLNLSFIAAAGDAIFSNLGLLFAIGVAVGLAKDNNGAAGLAGAACFLIASKGALHPIAAPADLFAGVPDTLQPVVLAAYKAKAIAKLYVPMGILSGLIGGNFYNRFYQLKLPDYLAFFAGRRFVPIAAGLAGLVLAGIFGGAFEYLDHGIDSISRIILGLGPIGLILYGIANRLLIITGLHHIINNLAWFILGDYHGATGDLNRFFAGDPSAGVFMAGFFPVMMFGLPAACLAMYHTALPERKKAVGGMLLSMALTALLTGVTEPIEFAFMFLAPVLFVLHAVLTGIAFVIMDVLGVRLGFSFSAGLFDYVINFKLATRPLLLIPVGAVYFGLYYGLFRLFIRMFDLKTPGREPLISSATATAAVQASSRGEGFVLALGGAANLASVDACTTRLRLIINDQGKVDEAALRALGAKGMVRPSDKALQVVLGPIADQVAGEIRIAWGAPVSAPVVVVAPEPAPAVTALDASSLLTALGGKGNIAEVLARSSRLLVTVRDGAKIAEAELAKLAPRGVVRISATHRQIIIGEDAEGLALGLTA
jgi:PTS system N-acetylglucosamine-specific IIC component